MSSSIAPLAAGFRRRTGRFGLLPPYPNAPGVAPIDGGDGGPIGLMVELYLGNTWTDISPFVFYESRIQISRGKPNETSALQPQTCALVINNRDGRFSPRNPLSPYYGLIGRNTPLRVSRLQNGVRRYRFYGEVPSWPTTWDISGQDVRVAITATGPWRRLSQGNLPLRSALYRSWTLGYNYTSGLFSVGSPLPPVAYWPCEDGPNSATISSGLSGGAAMALSGQAAPKFAQDATIVSSDSLPLLNGSIWTGQVPTYTGGTAIVLSMMVSIPATGGFNNGILARFFTTGTVARVDIQYQSASNGSVTATGYSSTGTVLVSSSTATGLNGNPGLMSMQIIPDPNTPGDVFYALDFIAISGNVGGGGGPGLISTIGSATSVVINPLGQFSDTAVGHVAIQNAYDGITAPIGAWINESPTIRVSRLCGEQGVPVVLTFSVASPANPGDVTVMGYQTIDTFSTLLQQCADSAFGVLYESRDQLALAWRTKGTLFNQDPKLTLDYSRHQLSGPLNPVDDDALTRNDITVSRIGGSSVSQLATSGTLSVLAPPAGVGAYATSYNLSLGYDGLLPDQAGWRLRLGTVDQPRYPQIPINLRHPTFTSNLDLMNAALTIDIGDRLVVVNPPPFMPPDAISQIVLGYTETLGIWEHDIAFNCAPEDPWRVAMLEDPVLGHLDTDGSTLAGTYPLGTETVLSVATIGAATGSPLWTTSAGDFPFDITVGGERMTVTGISGASSPQTFTVTRSVNGIVKAQTAGTDVRLWQPMYFGL